MAKVADIKLKHRDELLVSANGDRFFWATVLELPAGFDQLVKAKAQTPARNSSPYYLSVVSYRYRPQSGKSRR